MNEFELKANGYVVLTEEFVLPHEEEYYESILRQLDRGKHPVQYYIQKTGPDERVIWARPVTQAYEGKE